MAIKIRRFFFESKIYLIKKYLSNSFEEPVWVIYKTASGIYRRSLEPKSNWRQKEIRASTKTVYKKFWEIQESWLRRYLQEAS